MNYEHLLLLSSLLVVCIYVSIITIDIGNDIVSV